MDLSEIAKKLDLSESKHLVRRAAELRRLADVQFNSSVIGVGEICKAIICLEMAATSANSLIDRQRAIKLSGMSQKAYIRSFNAMQNGIGVKNKLDIRELGIQFGCIRLIPLVQKGLSLYRDRFLASLPTSRRASADCSRPVFTAVAFYLCVKKHKVEVVISLLPPSCHQTIAKACIENKKHLVTASYVDDSLSKLDEAAKAAGIMILGEMGLDPGIDHMMAMKMINEAHIRGGRIRSFISYCGGLPSPEAANNPLAYKFSWNPAGAIRAGSNPTTYKYHGEIVQVDGNSLYYSAAKIRLPDLPAFALECLPNRNSLIYGDLYGFGSIMGTLARIGFFDTETYSLHSNIMYL